MKFFTQLAACAALSLVAVVPVQASTVADQGAYVSHTIDCLGLLLSDPTAHAAQCGGPFAFPTDSKSIAPGSYKSCDVDALLDDGGIVQFSGELKVAEPYGPCYHGCAELTGPSFQFNTIIGDRIQVACN